MAAEERVLCFERKLLEELGVFQGLSLEVEKYLAVVTSSSNLAYRNRSEAEQDKRFKQLIPYVLIMYVANEAVAGRRSGIVGPEFIPIPEAVEDPSGYESWSRCCLENRELLRSRAAAAGVVAPGPRSNGACHTPLDAPEP